MLAHSCLNQIVWFVEKTLSQTNLVKKKKKGKALLWVNMHRSNSSLSKLLNVKSFPLQKFGLSTTIACVEDETKPLG